MIKQRITIFLEFVELRTKVASVFPMLAGFLWSVYRYGTFNWLNAGLFVLAVLLFDMCTTAINNTMDYHKAIDLTYKSQENVIGKYQLDFKRMVQIVLGLLGSSIVFSLGLVYLTDPLLLILGAVCFLIGITYTYGPMPLSRLPLGEVFSGVTMGFGIVYLAIYMSLFQQLLSSEWIGGIVTIRFNWSEALVIFWLSLPLVLLIAAIMLANNTCDLEVDVANQRYTLVYYLGKQLAVTLYTVLQGSAWLVWLTFILAGALPWWAVFGIVVMFPHWQSVQRFRAKQIKRETFVESVRSFVMVSSMYCGVLLLAIIFK